MNERCLNKFYIVTLLAVTMSSCVPHNNLAEKKEWIDPKRTICQANGGKMIDGSCHASWQRAHKICQASNARLPSLDEMRELIYECGGIVADYNFFSHGGEAELAKREAQNRGNTSYQKCYKAKGFLPRNGYWSSKERFPQSQGAWYVRFEEGSTGIYQKAAEYSVRCKRKI